MKLSDFNKAKPVVDRLEALQSLVAGLKGRKVAKISFQFGSDDHGSHRSLTVTGPAAAALIERLDELAQAELDKAEKDLAKIGSK